MKSDYAEIIVILDRSGSMESLKSDTIGGYNSFIAEQGKLPGTAKVTLVQFNDQYQVDYNGLDIKFVPSLTTETYVPGNTTALYDAIGQTINNVGQRLAAMSEQDRPSKVTVVIISDGLNNTSKEFTKSKIAEMIKHQTEKYNWQFTFLGTNFDAMAEGQGINIAKTNSLNYSNSSKGTKNAWQCLNNSNSAFRMGTSQLVSYSDADRQLAAQS